MNTPTSLNNPEKDSLQTKWQERFLRAILIGSVILGLFALIPTVISAPTIGLKSAYIGVYLVLVIATFVPLPYAFKAGIFAALPLALGISSFTETGIRGDGLVFLLAFVVFSALLLGPRAGIAAIIISELVIVIMGLLVLTNRFTLTAPFLYEASLEDWGSAAASQLLLSWVVMAGLRMLQDGFDNAQERLRSTLASLRENQQHLEERVKERTRELTRRTNQLNASAFIAKKATSIQSIKTLIDDTTLLITEQFGYYHAGIFLLNEQGDYAVLQAASSEGGKRMLERGHRLLVGTQGIVGYVAQAKTARIASDVGKAAIYFDNPELPETRSEVALPLAVQSKIIGVLDIQSTEPQAFAQDDLDVLQSLADQIAIGIDNCRLLESSQQEISQLEVASSDETRLNWQSWLSAHRSTVYYSPLGLQPVDNNPIPQADDENIMAIPIILHGQPIGKVTMRRKPELPPWTDNEKSVAAEVATQAALAINNARLLEQSEERARREKAIAKISGKIRETLDIQSILRTSAREVQRALNLHEAEIRLIPNMNEEIFDKRNGSK